MMDICNGNSYYMDIFRNKVDIWTLVAHSSVSKNIFINFAPSLCLFGQEVWTGKSMLKVKLVITHDLSIITI